MAPGTSKVVTRRSWLSRLRGSFKGIIFGLILMGTSFLLLFWNEGRAVSRYKALKEGRGIVISVPSHRIDSTNQDKLVHLTGQVLLQATVVESSLLQSPTENNL